MKTARKIIRIDEERCNGCGLCVPSCAEGAIQLVDGKARLVAEKYCDGLGACLGECPQGALEVVDAEAEAFDEAAAKAHVQTEKAAARGKEGGAENRPAAPAASEPDRMAKAAVPAGRAFPCGCPSTHLKTFAPKTACEQANLPAAHAASGESALTHWPVQIRLVPPTAPFLRGADLLVAADCTPVAHPRFHDELLRGRVVLLGCPKFDDAEDYVNKFAAIFRAADVKSITVAVMEVPCCQGLPVIVRKGMLQAGKEIPTRVIVVSAEGETRNK